MKSLRRLWPRTNMLQPAGYNSTAAYQKLLQDTLTEHEGDRDLAFAKAVGSLSMELFREQGDAHVAVLKHHGLAEGMAVYDLGCGCGRTAQALQRSGWQGHFIGADILPDFVAELKSKCPGYEAHVHDRPTIRAPDGALDIVYHWSVFTHVSPEECFLYLRDSFRALKPGGKTVFSFLEITEPQHDVVFDRRVRHIGNGGRLHLLDTFLHRDWIAVWARKIGFAPPTFTDGDDGTDHPPFWQTLATITKPA